MDGNNNGRFVWAIGFNGLYRDKISRPGAAILLSFFDYFV
jgi:hypothetical protein